MSVYLGLRTSSLLRCTYINCVTVCDDFKHYISPNNEHCYNNSDGERNMLLKKKTQKTTKYFAHAVIAT
ncbi:hypothetical protein NQ315_015512 [Exocentrus adspersus]|uniref:Secreted protein n=1 Tax=Exocentrus adspersus TaxID=1586481 RepID=A0AAV8VPC7_9CUCU|nr:hypothetical protein NQ315_015512 [Exocentrus adspersus]